MGGSSSKGKVLAHQRPSVTPSEPPYSDPGAALEYNLINSELAAAMGGGSSKGKVFAPQGLSEPPYPGPAVEYDFINSEVSMRADVSISTANNMVTTDIDSYYPILGKKYAEGFRMVSFCRIPGMVQIQGGFSHDIRMTYQGIFCRDPQMNDPSNEGTQLLVVKSLMTAKRMGHGLIQVNSQVVGDTSNIFQAILDHTRTGGRLICIQMTGQQQGMGVSAVMQGMSPLLGVDLFFESPISPLPELYIYQTVPCPVSVSIKIPSGTVCHCDWDGVLNYQLSQGWKLVEIFFDMAAVQMSALSASAALNSVWFFEKQAARLKDSTPVYEGKVVPHYIAIQLGMSGTKTNTNWEPVMQRMGSQGWELACIVETPETRFSQRGDMEMKILLFFQRPIITKSGPSDPSMSAPPPPYRTVPSCPPPPYPGGPSSPPAEILYEENVNQHLTNDKTSSDSPHI